MTGSIGMPGGATGVKGGGGGGGGSFGSYVTPQASPGWSFGINP
jgi:hypothetical protein